MFSQPVCVSISPIQFNSLPKPWIQRISSSRLIFPSLFWVNRYHCLVLPHNRLTPLEHRHNPDPDSKLVYAVADGQYTYGPLSLYQYQNDEAYSKTYVSNSFRWHRKTLAFRIGSEMKSCHRHCRARYVAKNALCVELCFRLVARNSTLLNRALPPTMPWRSSTRIADRSLSKSCPTWTTIR